MLPRWYLQHLLHLDQVVNTFFLGESKEERIDNLVEMINGYFLQLAHHLNVNVLDRSKLVEAMENPDKYPNLTIRISGYAVNFHKLTREQQMEILQRTYHEKV